MQPIFLGIVGQIASGKGEVVKKVEDTHRQILKKAQELGGFMINSSINKLRNNIF